MTISDNWRETLAEDTSGEDRLRTTVRDLDIGELMILSMHCSGVDPLAYMPPRDCTCKLQPGSSQHRVFSRRGAAISGILRLLTFRVGFTPRSSSRH
jgi:hypothetical protein